MSKRYRGISDSQANAEALARRSAPYAGSHAASQDFAWDYRQHIPDDLRGMVRAVRRAYADEVPTKLHEAEIGEGGTPRMTNAALSYLTSSEADDRERTLCVCSWSGAWTASKDVYPEDVAAARPLLEVKTKARDATPITVNGITWSLTLSHVGDCPKNPRNGRALTAHYLTPFKAALDRMEKAGPQQARRARMVRHITIGSQEPHLAAIAEGAHLFDAKLAAEDALRVFLTRYYSDLKVEVAA